MIKNQDMLPIIQSDIHPDLEFFDSTLDGLKVEDVILCMCMNINCKGEGQENDHCWIKSRQQNPL